MPADPSSLIVGATSAALPLAARAIPFSATPAAPEPPSPATGTPPGTPSPTTGVPSPATGATRENPPSPAPRAPSPTTGVTSGLPSPAPRAPAPPAPPSSAGPAPEGGCEVLDYPAGSLVLLAGLPGAGKSTLLDRLYGLRGDEREPVAAGGTRVIDSRQSRNWWARYLGPIPHRARTPLVHATHVWRIARAVLRGHDVVAHTRGTWSHILYGFAWLTRRTGGEVHLILLEVEPATARAGQFSRGRVVTAATFARHCRRWQVLVDRARRGPLPPAAGVTLLDRPSADRLGAIRFTGARPSRPLRGERPANRPGSPGDR
ncbi:ATP-binding protein [Streptosporangium sp. NPDC051023]|uniref:ATP-binding protein n=1 Tax=Streptosporangium sp. NPDC051023 TaxID=3155410 RepID=UPI003450FDA1